MPNEPHRAEGVLTERSRRAVALAGRTFLDHMGLELAADLVGAGAAHADEADAAAGQPLDRGHADFLGAAAVHHRAFLHAEVDDAAHRFWLDGSSLHARSSKWSPSAFSALVPARVRAVGASRRHTAACSPRPSAVSSGRAPGWE